MNYVYVEPKEYFTEEMNRILKEKDIKSQEEVNKEKTGENITEESKER